MRIIWQEGPIKSINSRMVMQIYMQFVEYEIMSINENATGSNLILTS